LSQRWLTRSREEELAVVAVGGATELRRSFAEVVRVRCRAAMVVRDGVHGGGVKLRRCRCRRGGCVDVVAEGCENGEDGS